MPPFSFLHMWLLSKLPRDEYGQATVEYVMLIMGVALFLILAALAMQSVLGSPLNKISSWIGGQNPP